MSLLLEVDAVYRRNAQTGELRLIETRQSNPEAVAWLTVLHLRRGYWHLTPLYSTSALAHDFWRIGD